MMMGRLPSCTAHDVDRVLTRQGFIVAHQRGSHRYYKSPITGKIVTSVPMHPGDGAKRNSERCCSRPALATVGTFRSEWSTTGQGSRLVNS
jgi:predicted RNA binding protein YcfA (HicA-like mRNA interferase family)